MVVGVTELRGLTAPPSETEDGAPWAASEAAAAGFVLDLRRGSFAGAGAAGWIGASEASAGTDSVITAKSGVVCVWADSETAPPSGTEDGAPATASGTRDGEDPPSNTEDGPPTEPSEAADGAAGGSRIGIEGLEPAEPVGMGPVGRFGSHSGGQRLALECGRSSQDGVEYGLRRMVMGFSFGPGAWVRVTRGRSGASWW